MQCVLRLPRRDHVDQTAADLRVVLEAGYSGAELICATTGILTPSTSESQLAGIAKVLPRGLSMTGVVIDHSVVAGLLGSNTVAAADAIDAVAATLSAAQGLGATMCALPLSLGDMTADASWRGARDAMLDLRFAAEDCAVRLAIEIGQGRFPWSPMECREFVDELTSPWVGLSLNIGVEQRYEIALDDPVTWINVLGPRIIRISGLGNVAHPGGDLADILPAAVRDSLSVQGFDGVVSVNVGGHGFG